MIIRIIICAVAGMWLVLIGAVWAEAAHAESDSDSYNFSWLDPEKKIYVLQNRKFSKAKRVQISALGGAEISQPFRTVYNIEPRVAFYFTEALGIEGLFTYSMNSANSTFTALQQSTGNVSLPLIRETRTQVGALIHWAPWYAKINVFNQILYFDWYFSLGGGLLSTAIDTNAVAGGDPIFQSENRAGVLFGTGHQFHLSRYMIFRLDFTGALYQAPIFGVSGDNTWFSNYNFGIGVGLKI